MDKMTTVSEKSLLRWSAQQEGQFFERKSALDRTPGRPKRRKATEVARDIAETLSAMANADGGELVVGMEDDGEITGVPYIQQRLEVLRNAPRTHVDPPLRCRIEEIRSLGNFLLLRFETDWSPEVHWLTDGRYLLRIGDSNTPFPAEKIAALKAGKMQAAFERTFPPGASLENLNMDLLRDMADKMRSDLSPEELLSHYRLIESRNGRLIPNLAGLLLFGKDPLRWHPRCGIDFARYEGTERRYGREFNVIQRKRVEAPLAVLIEQAYESVRPHIRERHVLHDLFFHERFEYPTFAWQEAIVNAVAHRDYSIQGLAIEILMFDDRLEIRSPGLPPQPVTVESLRARQRIHLSRNPLIVRVLTDLRYMQEQGEGIPRMFSEMERDGLSPPDLGVVGDMVFEVILRNGPIYDEDTRRWLTRFDAFELSGDQRRLLAYTRAYDGRFTSHKYQELVGTDIYGASRDIKDLIRKGLVRLPRKGGRVYELVRMPAGELQIPEEFEPVVAYLKRHTGITNRDLRGLLDINRRQASYLTDKWVKLGLLELEGRGRGPVTEQAPD